MKQRIALAAAVLLAPLLTSGLTGGPVVSGPFGSAAIVSAAGEGDFTPLSPARLLDTRAGYPTVDGKSSGAGIAAAGSTIQLQVGGRGGVPANAPAAVLNVTSTGPTGTGFLTVYACNQPRPVASSLNFSVGRDQADAVLTRLDPSGKVCIYSGVGATHVVVDVNGVFPVGSTYGPLAPARVLDTRPGYPTIEGRFAGAGITAAGSTVQLQIGGRGGVPANASAAVLNVTSTGAAGTGFLTVYPCNQSRPVASSLNYSAGLDVANAVLSRLDPSGKVCVYTGIAATHLVVDVTGAFPSGSSFSGIVPARLIDSRPSAPTVDGQYVGTGLTTAGTTLSLQVGGRGGVPADAGAVVLNVTSTGATSNGFLTVYVCSQPRPTASNLNFGAGRDVANAVLTQLGAGGKVCIYTGAGATHLVVDVTGVLPGPQFVNPGNSRGCVFTTTPGASVPFCETFDAPRGNPALRSGDLEPVLWGVSRTNTFVNLGQNMVNDFYAATITGCGAPRQVLPPRDVQICDGQVFEAVNDGHEGRSTLAMYPKQPFDISGGRTGTVVFDVSADSDSTHAAWPEFWWTDKPVPAPSGHLSSQDSYARHSFGFSMAGQCPGNQTTIDRVMVTRNYAYQELPFTVTGCVDKATAGGPLNHFEMRINTNSVDIYASDPGQTAVRRIATASGLNLTFTKGLIWMADVHYNACKMAPDDQCDHTFSWDNVGFDGPATYRDLSFDVPDANVVGTAAPNTLSLGYSIPPAGRTLTLNGVFRNQTPTGAIVTFNFYPYPAAVVPSFRINGGPMHSTAWPWPEADAYAWRTLDVAIPLAEVRDGTNTIEFFSGQAGDSVVVSNVNVILIAGAPVP